MTHYSWTSRSYSLYTQIRKNHQETYPKDILKKLLRQNVNLVIFGGMSNCQYLLLVDTDELLDTDELVDTDELLDTDELVDTEELDDTDELVLTLVLVGVDILLVLLTLVLVETLSRKVK